MQRKTAQHSSRHSGVAAGAARAALLCLLLPAALPFFVLSAIPAAAAVSAAEPPAAASRPLEFYGPPYDPRRKFISSGVIKPKIIAPKPQMPDFPPFSAKIFVPKFFDSHERFERADLSGLSRLRFLTSTDFFPFNYIDSGNNLAGYHVDLARALCAELRLENICSIEAAPWGELETRLRAGEADALIAGLAPTAQNRVYLGFSRAYMRFPARFIARAGSKIARDSARFQQAGGDFADFLRRPAGGLRLGVIGGTAHEQMLRAYFAAGPAAPPPRAAVSAAAPGHGQSLFGWPGRPAGLQFIPFADEAALIAALQAGQIELAFGDGLRFALLMNAQPAAAPPPGPLAGQQAGGKAAPPRLLFVGGYYPGIGYLGQGLRLAAVKNSRGPALQLLPALNYALQQLERKGKLAELYLRYFPIGFY